MGLTNNIFEGLILVTLPVIAMPSGFILRIFRFWHFPNLTDKVCGRLSYIGFDGSHATEASGQTTEVKELM